VTSQRFTMIKRILIGLVGGLVLLSVGRAMVEGSTFAPDRSDLKHARRTAKALGAGDASDARAPIPDGFLVGGNAIVEPDGREIRVGSPVAGLIKRILVKEGDWVKEGDALVQLDDGVESAALRAAQADVDAARAQLGRTKGALRWEDRQAVYAEADAARARAELSRQTHERLQKLYDKGAATQDERDKSKWQAGSDAAAARAAAERARAARAGARRDDVLISEQGILQAEARLLQARATLERLTVRAPRAGRILQVLVRPGEYFSTQASNSWLLTMGDTRKLHARIDVDERDIARIAPGSPAFVTAEAFPGRRFPGKVIDVGRRMGRKNVRTDEPTERLDTKILEVLVALDDGKELVPGLRVMGYVKASGPAPVAATR
jgi:ABC exporter DevB family membrane fusion protein